MTIIRPDWLRFALTFYAQRLFMLPLVWFVFRVLNRVRVDGLENLARVGPGPVILAPNHVSAWDSWVGSVWSLSSRRRLVERRSYSCVLAAPENIPTPFLKVLTAALGAIPVDRDAGVEQPALQDLARIMREQRRQVVATIYPEGTRSRDGRLRRRGKPGLGWLQHQTGATVVPIFHAGARQMPGVGLRMRVRIGEPIRFDHLRDRPDTLDTWRTITGDVMDALRRLEQDDARAQARRRGRPAGPEPDPARASGPEAGRDPAASPPG